MIYTKLPRAQVIERSVGGSNPLFLTIFADAKKEDSSFDESLCKGYKKDILHGYACEFKNAF